MGPTLRLLTPLAEPILEMQARTCKDADSLWHSSPVSRPSVEARTSDEVSTRHRFSSWRGWLRWAFAVAILLSCALFIDFGLVLATLRSVPVSALGLILGLWTVDRFLMAGKWLLLLRPLGVEIGFSRLVRFYYQGSFAGLFMPSGLGGDVLRAYWVARESDARHEVVAALLMEKLVGFVSALNWAWVGLFVLVLFILPQASIAWAVTVIVAAAVLNGLFLLSLRPNFIRPVQRTLDRVPRSRWSGFLQRLCGAYSQYSHCWRAVGYNGLLTIVEHGLQMLIVFAMARSLGIDADAILLLAITGIYLLIYRIPLSPDGWGIGEVTAVGLFGLIGVPAESGFALAFLGHVLQTLVVLPGLWFLWRSGPMAAPPNRP